jgi:hypothetical protein
MPIGPEPHPHQHRPLHALDVLNKVTPGGASTILAIHGGSADTSGEEDVDV